MNTIFWFDNNFDKELSTYITTHCFEKATLNAKDECYRWSKKLLAYVKDKADYNIEVHEGIYLIEGEKELSHTWVVINDKIFDPTYLKFEEDYEQMHEMNYLAHEVYAKKQLELL